MATSKQARAHQKRKQQQFEAKLARKAEARRRRNRVAGIVALIAIAGTAGIVGVAAFANNDAEPTPEATPTPTPDPTAALAEAPNPAVAEGRDWTAVIDTNLGPITLTLDGAAAPQAVASFVSLAREGYFDGTSCHRLVTGGIHVLQCGDPTGTGTGGPDYRFGPVENDPADQTYPRGTLAMARVGGDAFSMGSQFFIVFEDSVIPSDPAGGFGYTVFGTVTDGLAIVDGVAEAGTASGGTDGAPAQPVVLNEVSVS